MANKEKLLKLMKEYNVPECYYSRNMDLNADTPSGDIMLIGKHNSELVIKVYMIYTEDGVVNDNQMLLVDMIEKDSDDFTVFVDDSMEVLYTDI